MSLRSFLGCRLFHWGVDRSPWSSQYLLSCFPLLLDFYQRFQTLAGSSQVAPFRRCRIIFWISRTLVLGLRISAVNSLHVHDWWLFCWISFRPPCSSFSSYRLSASDTDKWGREDSSMCFLELSVVRGHLDWCHVKFRCRPDSKQWVRSAEHAGTFIYDPHISFFFLTSKKKNPDKFSLSTKENNSPFVTL